MLCQNCGKNEANVRYTEIINGNKKEIVLCSECSEKLGIDSVEMNMPINFSSFFGDLISDYENNNFISMFPKEELKCNNCNMTYQEFLDKGTFGCSECYNAFSDKIENVLKKIHGSNRHLGRKSKEILNKNVENIYKQAEESETKKEKKIEDLEEQLKQAIKEERYEDAAKIRDKIKNKTK